MKRAVLTVAVVALAAAPAGANDWIELEVWKYYDVGASANRYGSGLWAGVDGVTGAGKMVADLPGAGSIPLTEEDLGGGVSEYSGWAEGLTLVQLNAILAGACQIEVTTPGGVCVYDFTISSIPDSLFAPLPVVTNPTFGATGVPQNVMLQWTWAGGVTVDELWTEVVDLAAPNPTWAEDSSSGGLALTDLSWQPNLTQTGWAVFTVGYDIVAPMDGSSIVSAITFNGAASTGVDFVWDEAEACAIAEGRTGFQVVPEPASAALLMLGLPLLASIRRRK